MKIPSILIFLLSLGLLSCNSDPEPELLFFDDVELTVLEEYTIPNGDRIEWIVADTAVAIIEGNTIYAKRVGFTQVYASSQNYSFNLLVNPVTLFNQPCMSWGASKDDIKKYMVDYEILEESKDYLGYKGKYRESFTYYIFEDDKLSYCEIILERNQVSWDEFIDFFAAKYIFEFSNDEGDILYFVTYDHNTLIVAELTDIDGIPVCLVYFQPLDFS